MAVSIVEYEVKLKTLLKEFLTPSYQIRNDVYLSSLLSHFSGKNDKGNADSSSLAMAICAVHHLFDPIIIW